MYLDYYKNQLGPIPSFLIKYLQSPSLIRLKKIGYFCGMDYASKKVYNFREPISRYDHSLTVALLVYKLTRNKTQTIAGLFHDISTPCFAHVIDYMNKDYANQESTEMYTEDIILKDPYLQKCLKIDGIDPQEIIHFKDYTIVDNDRPKLCADRLDGIILTAIGWSKNISLEDINNILKDVDIFLDEEGHEEIGFHHEEIAKKTYDINEEIDRLCHSKEDNYMMTLLGNIAQRGIENKLFTYEELFLLTEDEIMELLLNSKDKELLEKIKEFSYIRKENIPNIKLPYIKKRNIQPLVQGKRIKISES